jgi:hypothetical protein
VATVIIGVIATTSLLAFMRSNDKNVSSDVPVSQNATGDVVTSPGNEAATDQPTTGDNTDTASTSQNQSTNTSSDTATIPSNGGSTYDPHACDSYKATADSLKTASDQKKAAWDTAFGQQKTYGDFYSAALQQYDTTTAKTVADQEYNQQKDYLTQLQTDWNNSLTDYNDAYHDYQACMSKNLGTQ